MPWYTLWSFWEIITFAVEFLQEKLSEETSRPEFSELPFRSAEIAKILLDVYVVLMHLCLRYIDVAADLSASDDIEDADKLRSVLKDLREARQAKSREGLRVLDHNALSVRKFLFVTILFCFHDSWSQLPNLSAMEINEIRPFFVRAMGILGQLAERPAANDNVEGQY